MNNMRNTGNTCNTGNTGNMGCCRNCGNECCTNDMHTCTNASCGMNFCNDCANGSGASENTICCPNCQCEMETTLTR